MAFGEYDTFDAVGLAGKVRANEISVKELFDEVVSRIETTHAQLNAVVCRMYEQAEKEIRIGLPKGPFHGVPFLLKDLSSACAGVPFTCGSRYLKNYIPTRDAEVVSRYRKGGFVILGKTNTPEFGYSFSTEPALYGPTRNPWDLTRIPGGSSGGSASAVAAGIVPAAHASDGGGSIRVPAACCGLFGLKPTRNRIPLGPDRAEGGHGMSVVHVVTRSVRDSAAILDLTAGPLPGDPYWPAPPIRPYVEEIKIPPGPLSVALSLKPVLDTPIDPECAQAARETAKLLSGLGHRVDEVDLHISQDDYRLVMERIFSINIAASIHDYTKICGREPTPQDLEPVTWQAYQHGQKFSGVELAQGIQVMHRIGRAVGNFFEKFDLLITPATAQLPVPLRTLDMTGETSLFLERSRQFAPFTALFNMSGNPAMSVPLHWTEKNLPVGVQIVGRYGDEATLFRIAAQLEQSRPWFHRRPTLR